MSIYEHKYVLNSVVAKGALLLLMAWALAIGNATGLQSALHTRVEFDRNAITTYIGQVHNTSRLANTKPYVNLETYRISTQ